MGCHRIPKTDISLNRNPGTGKITDQPHAHAAIFRFIADCFDPHAVSFQCQAIIVDREVTEFAKDFLQTCFATVTESQKVHIACRTVNVFTPQHKEHRSFQYEAIPIFRFTEAVQESFQTIPGEDRLEILAPFTGESQQTITGRGADVLAGFIVQVTRDSR